MPEQLVQTFYKSLKKEWKIAFLTSILVGIFTHLVVFTKYLPNHDGVIMTYSQQLNLDAGRFFLGPASWISSKFDISLIAGSLSIFYLALLAVCLVELFQIRKLFSILFVSSLVVTFPTVPSVFSYMFTADAYFLGYLLSGVAVLWTAKRWWGIFPGILLFYFGVGIYQAILPFTLSIVTVYIISLVLRKVKWKTVVIELAKQIGLVVSGMALYMATFLIYRSRTPIENSYQGLDEVGKLDGGFVDTLVKGRDQFVDFFYGGFFSDIPLNAFTIFNVVVTLTLIYFIVFWIVRGNLIQGILALLGVILIPMFTFILNFVSPGVIYHSLMLFGLIGIYLVVILFLDQLTKEKWSAWITVLVLAVTIYNFSLITNVSYLHMQLRHEKALSLTTRMVSTFESHPEFSKEREIYIVGNYRQKSRLSNQFKYKIPPLAGIKEENITVFNYQLLTFMKTNLGLESPIAHSSVMKEITATEEFADMPVWPAEGSLQLIDEVLVLKLN